MADEIDDTGGPVAGDMSTQIDVLKEDPKSEETPPSTEETEIEPTEEEEGVLGEKEEEEEEEKDEDEEEEEEEEEEPKSATPDILPNRPSFKEIQAKFPNIFKEFPELRNVYFREKAFSDLFPSVADAKDASEKLGAMNELESQVMSGQSFGILEAIGDRTTLRKFAMGFLPTLLMKDKDVYIEATKPVLINIIRNVYAAGVQAKDENLKNSAHRLSMHYFQSAQIPEFEKTGPKEDDPERQSLEEEKRQFYGRIEGEFRNDAFSSAERSFKKEIEHSLDPNNVLTPFLRNALIKTVYEETGEALEEDGTHMAMMQSLWEKAKRAGFPREFKARIVNAYLGRARALMPAIRRKRLAEALGKQDGGTPEKIQPEKKIIPSGGTPVKRTGPVRSVKEARARGMSPLDVLKEGSR